VPQLRVPLQPFEGEPQVAPREAHVFGVQVPDDSHTVRLEDPLLEGLNTSVAITW
jgi:hypothetical protein